MAPLWSIRLSKATNLVRTAFLRDYEVVCRREEYCLAAALIRVDVAAFLDGLAVLAEPVMVRDLCRPQLRDAGDEMVLETAVNGQARAIIAFNHRDYGNATAHVGMALPLPTVTLGRIEE